MSRIREIVRRDPTSVSAEHERRFIIDAAHAGALSVAATATNPRYIEQGYVMVDSKKYRVRATTAGSSDPSTNETTDRTTYALTRKARKSRITRAELEWDLTQEEFGDIWPETEGWRISKVRRDVASADGYPAYEVDAFNTKSGLVVAEVERQDPSELDDLKLPDHFGPEITGLSGWGSSGVARHPVTASELAIVMDAWRQGLPVRPRA